MTLWILALLLFPGCTPSPHEEPATPGNQALLPEDPRLPMLDSTWQLLLDRLQSGQPASIVKPMLTDSSQQWLEDMENAAATETPEEVETRPFYEQMTILTYRMFDREGVLNGVYYDRLLQLVMGQNSTIVRKVKELELGPFEIRNDRGARGLATSPHVAILYFTWIDQCWKFDLLATMPIVLRGYETIGIKKDWATSKTALYLLEKSYRHQLKRDPDSTLFDPVPPM
ncbi:MAG TPA: hypothetical protein VLM37_08970 [Fibrobacteraceae bacterium]|nr:hypothetical protein [Fibrobacteraceae bacterium]